MILSSQFLFNKALLSSMRLSESHHVDLPRPRLELLVLGI